jgi:hypothetical protein
MVYLNFTKITPAAPNDPNVDEAAQLNANWDLLDAKLAPYMVGGTISNVQQGQEFFSGADTRYAVWDGTATRIPDTMDTGWSAWTNFPMAGTFTARSGFRPKWRVNTIIRRVECVGGVIWDAAGNAWSNGLWQIFADAAGDVPATYLPVGGKAVCIGAGPSTSAGNNVAASYFVIDKPVGYTNLRIQGQYLGGLGGGNFIQLDQVGWWY